MLTCVSLPQLLFLLNYIIEIYNLFSVIIIASSKHLGSWEKTRAALGNHSTASCSFAMVLVSIKLPKLLLWFQYHLITSLSISLWGCRIYFLVTIIWLIFVPGTLLGVVKFQDIIPWDHDGDISYVLGSGSSEFHEELAAHGIQSNGLIATYKGLSIDYVRWIPKTGTFNGEETLLMEKYYPAHIWKSDNIVVRYHHKLESFPQSWVVPSKKINFQGVQVTIPNSPEVFLANRYPYSYRLNINVPYKWKCYIPCAFRASKWCQERRGSWDWCPAICIPFNPQDFSTLYRPGPFKTSWYCQITHLSIILWYTSW